MKAQQIFDRVVKHLYTQGRPSRPIEPGEGSACLYRGPNGMKCAVGVLITDRNYRRSMETVSIGALVSLAEDRYSLPKYMHDNRKLLGMLQEAHDFCWVTNDGRFDLANLRSRLQTIASYHRLVFIEPTEVAQ